MLGSKGIGQDFNSLIGASCVQVHHETTLPSSVAILSIVRPAIAASGAFWNAGSFRRIHRG
jgi:hypothetical protein